MKYASNCPQMIDLSKHGCQLSSPRFARGPIPSFRPLFVPVALAPFKPLHHSHRITLPIAQHGYAELWSRRRIRHILLACPTPGCHRSYVHILCNQTPTPLSLSLLSTLKLVQAVRPVKGSSLCPSTYQDTDNQNVFMLWLPQVQRRGYRSSTSTV